MNSYEINVPIYPVEGVLQGGLQRDCPVSSPTWLRGFGDGVIICGFAQYRDRLKAAFCIALHSKNLTCCDYSTNQITVVVCGLPKALAKCGKWLHQPNICP